MVAVHAQADLLEVVLALRACGRFADLLHGRNEQPDQDGDDGDDDEQFNQRERSAPQATTQSEHGSRCLPIEE